MATDVSRKLFIADRNYSGVLMQQGRVILDADWNEQLDIQRYRTEMQTRDVIGACGVPKKGNSFKISPIENGADLIIDAGRIYVGGLLCELKNTIATTTYFNQPYYPNPDESYFLNIPASPPDSPPLSPPPPPQKLKDGTYIIYIDAWQREINYLDDPLIHEVALGEADTTTRLQNVWQVRLLPVTNPVPDCKTKFEEWDELITPPSGKLNVRTEATDDPIDPCGLPPGAGYRRLENQLYRVEVQKGGTRANATFKWSRDNASVETAIEEINGSILTVADKGKDEVLGFTNGQWVEVIEEESTLKSTPPQLIQIISVDPAKPEITLSTSDIPNKNNGRLKLRRWDQSVPEAGADGLPATTGWIDLEGGIQVNFSEGNYRAGDYWLIPARAATGEVEWPPYDIPNLFPIEQAPLGIHHYYCRLAILKVQGDTITVEDCRPLFPSLTEICAEDICYDNSNCQGSIATTVQQALDELCQERDSACTLLAQPGKGWERVFDQISEGGDAQVCFQVGDYPLDRPVNISHKGHLKLTGCGQGTRILSSDPESALRFSTCKTVIVRDLYAETAVIILKSRKATSHLNGTLTFIDCAAVTVKGVNLKCGSGTVRSATCLSIRNEILRPCSVCIQNCNLNIGSKQQGILMINTLQALVENNTLRTYGKPAKLQLPVLVKDKQQRAGIRKILVSGISGGKIAPEESTASRNTTNVKLNFENKTVYLKTNSFLKNAWQDVIKSNPPAKTEKPKDILIHANKLADRILTDQAFRNRFPRFRQLFELLAKQELAAASQGITIGGQIATDIRILNNRIENCLQGIHVGTSHRVAEGRNSADLSETVTISGNTIAVLLPVDAGKLDRYGIFVGNCKSLIVENNNVSIKRAENAENFIIDGIRVWGMLGDRLMITKNYLFSVDGDPKKGFDIGIRVHPLQQKPGNAQWVVMWNVAPSRQRTVSVLAGAVAVPETNTP